MKSIAWLLFGALLATGTYQIIAWMRVTGMPSIPESVLPQNGEVVEYWPNGNTRSERLYRDHAVQEAVYYSSDGNVVYEMSDRGSKR